MEFDVKLAKQQGRDHKLSDTNRQDAVLALAFESKGKKFYIGFDADGCSGGKFSEVGALLAVQFLCNETRFLIEQGHLPLRSIPQVLYNNCVDFVKQIARANHFPTNQDYANYIENNLLFTAVGFIIGPEETIIMAAGDGVVIINEDINFRDENDKALYLGYHAIDRAYISPTASALPTNFDVYTIPTDELKRLAVGSDSWLNEKELLAGIWGHRRSAQLQGQINVWSDQGHHFKDDVSIIVVEAKDVKSDNSTEDTNHA